MFLVGRSWLEEVEYDYTSTARGQKKRERVKTMARGVRGFEDDMTLLLLYHVFLAREKMELVHKAVSGALGYSELDDENEYPQRKTEVSLSVHLENDWA